MSVSASLISRVTDAVLEKAKVWQNRPREAIHPTVYLGAIHLTIRTNGRVQNQAVCCVALGIDLAGQKQLLGLSIKEAGGAKSWLNVFTDLSNQGVRDILLVAVDGLSGFPEAIATVYPKIQLQLRIMHF